MRNDESYVMSFIATIICHNVYISIFIFKSKERRGKKIENDSKNPPVSPIANTLNGAPPSGAYINHFNSAGAARFDRLNGAVSPLRTRSANGKCGSYKNVK